MSQVHLRWAGGQRLDAGRIGGPTLRLDRSGETGQSPMDGLLSSLAGCTSIDVMEILAKRRTPVSSLTVDVDGTRVASAPRRFKHITLHFKIAGDDIDRAQAERAIDLSLNKYCSVRASLQEDIQVEWTLELSSRDSSAL